MEGKELYSNEDEELDPKSNKEEGDSDDFGLPEIEGNDDDTSNDLEEPYTEPWNETKEDEDYLYSSDDVSTSSDASDDNYLQDEGLSDADSPDDEDKSSYYEEKYGEKKNPVGWIIFGLFVLVAIVVGVLWWMNREPEPEIVVQKAPVIVQPAPEPEPEVIEEEPEPVPVKEAGVFEINAPTGRYHVIVASSIDKDLVHDYGTKLAKQGMTCNILAPIGNRKFHRLSVADYEQLMDAAAESERLKNSLGADVWVIRY